MAELTDAPLIVFSAPRKARRPLNRRNLVHRLPSARPGRAASPWAHHRPVWHADGAMARVH
jgi:hypothetical protein